MWNTCKAWLEKDQDLDSGWMNHPLCSKTLSKEFERQLKGPSHRNNGSTPSPMVSATLSPSVKLETVLGAVSINCSCRVTVANYSFDTCEVTPLPGGG